VFVFRHRINTYMTNILLASDFHIKHSIHEMKEIVSDVNRDIAIFLGDLSKTYDTTRFEEFIRHHLQFSDIIFVLGNHEYFSDNFHEAPNKVRRLFDVINKTTPHNAYVLENDTFIMNDIRFIGTTLWSNLDLTNTDVSDSMVRRCGKYGVKPEDILEIHNRSSEYIRDTLAQPVDYKTIVLSHHAPSVKSIASKFANSPTNSMYASSMDDMIVKYQPEYWLHAHIHESVDYFIDKTHILSNTYGYSKIEHNTGYNSKFIIKV